MRIFVELTHFAATASRAQLRDRLRAIEDVGATGVTLWDHIFISSGARPCDPLTSLAAVAALSDRLEVQTVVMNSEWMHPGLLLRQFAQLAVLIGGERVTAGLGAGWNAEEFEALGLKMAPFKARLDRLEETFQIARQLFHRGVANLEGRYVTARNLPLSPVCATAPRLLIGGGSDRVLEIAGRYADVIDFHGDPKHGKMVGATVVDKHAADVRRRALTTVDDLAERVPLVRAAARAAGRDECAVTTAVHAFYVIFGSKAQVAAAEEDLCANWGHIPTQSLAQCPYLLMGEPRQIADTLAERQARFGLGQIQLREDVDVLRFCREVLPLLH